MADDTTLYISWTSDNQLTVHNMLLLYMGSSMVKKRWEKIHVIVWGAAAELLATDVAVRDKVREFLQLGGEMSVCKRCLENINRLAEYEAMTSWGKLEIFYVGDFFTKIIKEEHLITV